MTLLFLDKVEVVKEYDREIGSVSTRMKFPAVIRLLHFVRTNRLNVRFSRRNVFLRDDYICQYCGRHFEAKHLTLDHIMPKSRGGITEWTNIVTSCVHCNLKKGDRLVDEVGMHPKRKPTRPAGFHVLMLNFGVRSLPEYWKDYVFLRD